MPPRRAWKSIGHAVPVADGMTKAAERIAELGANLARAHRLHEATQRTLEAQVARVFSAEDVERAARAMYERRNPYPTCWGWGDSGLDDEHYGLRDAYLSDARAALSAVGRVIG